VASEKRRAVALFQLKDVVRDVYVGWEFEVLDFNSHVLARHTVQRLANVYYLNVTRDLKKCYFRADELGVERSGIYEIDLDSGEVRSVYTTKSGGSIAPSLSPDGRRIAFVEGGRNACIIDLDTQRVLRLIAIKPDPKAEKVRKGSYTYPPTWSRDSKLVVFPLALARVRGGEARAPEDLELLYFTAVIHLPSRQILLLPKRYARCAVRY